MNCWIRTEYMHVADLSLKYLGLLIAIVFIVDSCVDYFPNSWISFWKTLKMRKQHTLFLRAYNDVFSLLVLSNWASKTHVMNIKEKQ